jgi:hypothetical protein
MLPATPVRTHQHIAGQDSCLGSYVVIIMESGLLWINVSLLAGQKKRFARKQSNSEHAKPLQVNR